MRPSLVMLVLLLLLWLVTMMMFLFLFYPRNFPLKLFQNRVSSIWNVAFVVVVVVVIDDNDDVVVLLWFYFRNLPLKFGQNQVSNRWNVAFVVIVFYHDWQKNWNCASKNFKEFYFTGIWMHALAIKHAPAHLQLVLTHLCTNLHKIGNLSSQDTGCFKKNAWILQYPKNCCNL